MSIIMLIIAWKRISKQKNSPSFICHLHSNVFLFTAARQSCKRKWRLHNKRHSVLCDSRSQNRPSLCNVSFANNLKVIHHVRQTFFIGVHSSRRKGAFARGKVQHSCSESGKKLTIGWKCGVWHEVHIPSYSNEQVWNLESFSVFKYIKSFSGNKYF
jgi:hypothetical protein